MVKVLKVNHFEVIVVSNAFLSKLNPLNIY